MPKRLTALKLDEVSLVDRGANPGAHIALFKRRDPASKMDGDAATFDEIQASREVYAMMEELSGMYSTLCDSLYRIASDGQVADKLALIRTSIDEFSQAARGLFGDGEVGKVGAKVSAARMTRIKTAFESLKAVMEEVMPKADDTKKNQPAFDREKLEPAAKSHLEAVETENADLKKKLEAAEKKETPPAEDDVLKGVPEAVRKRLEAAEKKADEADKVAKAERDQRLEAEAIQKAEREYPLGDSKKLGPIMKRAAEALSADDYAELERTLKAAHEQLKKGGLFTVLGDGGAEKGGAREQLKLAAAELKKADPKLSEAQAITKAMSENPKLAAEARAEESSLH